MDGEYVALYAAISIFICSISLPLLHLLFVKNNVLNFNFSSDSSKIKNIGILLPVRDESIVITNKIDEIFNLDIHDYNINLLIIDSGSEDDTASIALNYLDKEHKDKKYKVLMLDKPGKSLAVSKGINLLKEEIIIMMDAEAILKKSTLNDIIKYFNYPKIGAVCGHHIPISGRNYRDFFNILRIGESAIDSSTIFEGSICAFRKSALSKNPLFDNINADDTQLALDVRRNGFRAIMAPDVSFTEPNISNSDNYVRKVRRAQGLIRVLFANRRMFFGNGKFGIFLASSSYFYILMPWLVFISFLIFSYSSISIISEDNTLKNLFLMIYGLILFFSYYSNILREFISGILCLLHAQLLFIYGHSLHIWKPNQNIRYNRKKDL